MFCRGQYRGCRAQSDESGCALEPGCRWYAPPDCITWTECAVLWLETGGCAEALETGAVGIGHGDESITYADYCH